MEVARQGCCPHEASSREQTARWRGSRVPAVAQLPVPRGGNCPVPGPLGTDHGAPGPACGHRSSPSGSCGEDLPCPPHLRSPPRGPVRGGPGSGSLPAAPCWWWAPRSRPVWLPFSGESIRRLQESLGCSGFDCGLGGAGRDFPGGSDSKSICLQCRRPGFDPWVRKIPWRRKWQPTAVLLPGKSHGQRNLVGYSPWGRKESDTTEQLHFHCGGTWRFASPEAGKDDSGAAGLPTSRPPGFVLLPRPLPELALLCEQWVAPSCFLAAPLLIGAPPSLFFMGCVAFLPRCSKAGPLLQCPLAGTEPCCFSLRPPCSSVTCPSSGSLGW